VNSPNPFHQTLNETLGRAAKGALDVLLRLPSKVLWALTLMVWLCSASLLYLLHWSLGFLACVLIALVMMQPQK